MKRKEEIVDGARYALFNVMHPLRQGVGFVRDLSGKYPKNMGFVTYDTFREVVRTPGEPKDQLTRREGVNSSLCYE